MSPPQLTQQQQVALERLDVISRELRSRYVGVRFGPAGDYRSQFYADPEIGPLTMFDNALPHSCGSWW